MKAMSPPSLEVVEEVVSEAVQQLRKRIPHAKINVSIPEAFLMVPMDPLFNRTGHYEPFRKCRLSIPKANRRWILLLRILPDSVTFHVIDYGKGLDEDKIPSLF